MARPARHRYNITMATAPGVDPSPELELVRSVAGPFEWLRIRARLSWSCPRCGAQERGEVPVFVEWLDREGSEEQARAAAGLSCPRCEWLEPLDLPLLQYRQADGIGLMVGLPARPSSEQDEAAIRDVLAVAGDARELEGAAAVAAVRMAWWGSLWNQPLGPRLLGCLPLVLPESGEEGERWRLAALEALALPDVGAALREFIEREKDREALEVIGAHPELCSRRWTRTVETLLDQLAEAQLDPEARSAVESRRALLRQVGLVGREWAGRSDSDARLDALVEDATRATETDVRLAALEALTEAAAESPAAGPLAVAASLAYVQALHGEGSRRAEEDERLVQIARRTLELARGCMGEEHEMTYAAELNLAVCVEENGAAEPDVAAVEALSILDELAPRVARSGSPSAADLATNLATLAERRPGARAERPEQAAALLEDAAHIRKLVSSERRRDVLVALVDRAATLRAKVSGSLRENAEGAISLLREALAHDAEWLVLSMPERALARLNLANALSTLRDRSPADATFEEVREAAHEAIESAAALDPHNAVAMQVYNSAGAVLVRLYSEFTAVGEKPPPGLWPEARDALERAFEQSKNVFAPHHPNTLHAALHLAAALGSVVDGEVAERKRSLELLEYVIDNARPHEAGFRRAAGTNLGQLRVGEGNWAAALVAYEVAAAAQADLFVQARTPSTRLGEIVQGGDLAVRHALALVMLKRPAEAVAVLEKNRVRLASGAEDSAAPGLTTADTPPPSRVVAHLATGTYATFGVLVLPGGKVESFVTTLTSRPLKAAMRALLGADEGGERSNCLDVLAELLGPAVIDPLVGLLDESDEPVEELALVACGALTSCPLHCVPAADGRTLARRFELRTLVSSAAPEPSPLAPPSRALAVIDPDGSLPYARSEREALAGWARELVEPPEGHPSHRWLLGALERASVAHLACHGALDPEDPMRSSFALGAGSSLSVADLAGLAAPELDLVVAPACQSASASPDAPDELLGVAHALLHSGARIVIASLWDADDAATALVVSRLYHELGEGFAPAPALARAQHFVADLDALTLAELCRSRLAAAEAAWLPYDLAIELLALSAHPRHRDSATAVFAEPAEWASLSCLEA
jgi:CHAT domain-containing protein